MDESEETNRFRSNELSGFLAGLLLEASLVLALDYSLDFKDYHPYN
jgi:hypothetical protein